jgi:uncharacterized protein YlzI (FlbEa/FlbD family)
MIEFSGPGGEIVRLNPDLIESVMPDADRVIIRLINGRREQVRGPYRNVLDRLAGC